MIKKDKKVVSYSLTKEVIDKLEELNEETGVQKSFIVQKALEKYLEGVE